eukprot:4964443-Pleurochrysis_carterae.AAC.4
MYSCCAVPPTRDARKTKHPRRAMLALPKQVLLLTNGRRLARGAVQPPRAAPFASCAAARRPCSRRAASARRALRNAPAGERGRNSIRGGRGVVARAGTARAGHRLLARNAVEGEAQLTSAEQWRRGAI